MYSPFLFIFVPLIKSNYETIKSVIGQSICPYERQSSIELHALPSRNTKRFSLLHFDGTTNRALRYARNQKSVFEDEQDDKAILEPIIFEDGALIVSSTNPVLGKFLDLHPLNGDVFRELNKRKKPMMTSRCLNIELDAQVMARSMSIETMESVGRLIYGAVGIDKMTSSELKRDIMLYARKYPKQFIELANDPDLEDTQWRLRR
jgi:hypothetical protein